jgi:N6-L-threonylcarbamoyladenine synthase
MLILGIETSCDETGVAVYDAAAARLLAHAVHSQVAMHQAYGGVVPELASRDHIRRLVPLTRQVLGQSRKEIYQLAGIGYTQGPGLAGALLVGASFAHALGLSLRIPVVGIHHLEGHLLSPRLSARPPGFPFVALLVSGGHTQLMRVDAVGEYRLLGETQDDAAGEAFDKTAQLLGLGYPGGPALSRLAEAGRPGRIKLPRPMLHSDDLEFSFSGLKTAVLTAMKTGQPRPEDLARAFVDAVVEVLVAKSVHALRATGLERLVVAGGVGANRQLRAALDAEAARRGFEVFYPEPELCTDNGAMIAFAAALRLGTRSTEACGRATEACGFSVKPRWDLEG